jgi:hypothetical protein
VTGLGKDREVCACLGRGIRCLERTDSILLGRPGSLVSKAPRERGIRGTGRKAFAVLTGTSDVRQVVAHLPKRTSANWFAKAWEGGEKEM